MATLDLVTLSEAQDFLRAAQSVDQTLLGSWITSASVAIDDLCGPVVQRTLTAELHDGGRTAVLLLSRPVSSVTSVTEYGASGASTALTAESVSSKPASGYLLDDRAGMVFRRASGADWCFAAGRRNVSVTYVAGRVASTAAVTPRFKTACLMLVSHLWRVEHGTGNTFGQTDGVFTSSGFAVPNRVVELLGSEVQADRRLGVA